MKKVSIHGLIPPEQGRDKQGVLRARLVIGGCACGLECRPAVQGVFIDGSSGVLSNTTSTRIRDFTAWPASSPGENDAVMKASRAAFSYMAAQADGDFGSAPGAFANDGAGE